MSLSLKPMRIEKIKKRRKISKIRALSATIKHEKLYRSHIDFIWQIYSSGKWINPHQAAPEIKPLLDKFIEDNNLWRSSPENREEWIYRTLSEMSGK